MAGKKARLLVPLQDGHDYYLIIMPLLLLVLTMALHCNLLSRAKALFARFSHDERAVQFRFGTSTVPWHEEKGRELLQDIEASHFLWAVCVLQYHTRRKQMARRPVNPARKMLNTLDRFTSRSLSFEGGTPVGERLSARRSLSRQGSSLSGQGGESGRALIRSQVQEVQQVQRRIRASGDYGSGGRHPRMLSVGSPPHDRPGSWPASSTPSPRTGTMPASTTPSPREDKTELM